MLVVAPAGSFHHHHQRAAAADDDPVLPLITTAQRTLVDADAAAAAASGNAKPSAGAIQFWHQEPPAADASSPGKKALAMLDHGRGGSGSGAVTCEDCGNQAKKGCARSRCRTCCNSRGFDCDTHVRSTWVPKARRRERLQPAGGGARASPPPPTPAAAKKPRLACPTPTTTTTTNSRASTSNATTPRSFDTSSSHQDASFKDSLPRQVRGPAVFRCVRVTSVDDGGGGGGSSGEVAYQAAVTINGHLFRGLLYDHGAEADGRSATAAVIPTTSDLNLSSAAAAPNLYSGPSAPLILGGLGYGNTS